MSERVYQFAEHPGVWQAIRESIDLAPGFDWDVEMAVSGVRLFKVKRPADPNPFPRIRVFPWWR